MNVRKFSTSPLVLMGIGLSVLSLVSGCSSTKTAEKEEEILLPRIKWYAHCDTCKWCKGSLKTTQEAQRIVSEHNIEQHDWVKVAYYDQKKCD